MSAVWPLADPRVGENYGLKLALCPRGSCPMKRTASVLASVLLLATTSGIAAPAPGKLDYPVAARDQTVTDYFGTQVPTPYQWMEDMQSPALHSWVEAENRLTDAYLAKIPVRGWITRRLTQLWNFPKESAPLQVGRQPDLLPPQRGPAEPIGAVRAGFTRGQAAHSDRSQQTVTGWLGGARRSRAVARRTISRVRTVVRRVRLGDAARARRVDGEDPPGRRAVGEILEHLPGRTVTTVSFTPVIRRRPRAMRSTSRSIDQQLYFHALGQPQSADRLIYRRPDLPSWVIGDR